MNDLLSVNEAKSRFAEVIRQVRVGRTITISYRGEPVAEMRPTGKSKSCAAQLEELRRQEILIHSKEPRRDIAPDEPSLGALDRFLAERND